MYVGHFAIGLALKARFPTVPALPIMLGAGFLDILDGVFIVLGWDRVAPNLLAQQFAAEAPNQKWLADLTYVPTAEGWLYLASVIDLCSRKIVGWAMSERMTTDLVWQALQMALRSRQPAAGLLHHSDRGSQYASHAYQTRLAANGMVISMSRRGNC